MRFKRFLVEVLIILVAIDQLSKFVIRNTFIYGESRPVIGHYFMLTYVENPNTIFSISLGKHFPYVIVGIVVILLLVVALIVEKSKWHSFLYTLLIAGACGNLIDRLMYHRVVDFFDFGINEKLRWAIFNFADSYITIGLILFGLTFIKEFKMHTNKQNLEKKEEEDVNVEQYNS